VPCYARTPGEPGSVEAIAVRVAMASPVNLRRRFRDQVGMTPGAYRAAFRGR
jgi:AraC family transcriptional activator FtrA